MRAKPTRDDQSLWNKATRAVKARDYKNGKPCCRLEVLYGDEWEECGSRAASDAAHLIARRHCGEYWAEPIVLLLACRDHHDIYDKRTLGHPREQVRAPRGRLQAAWDFLTSVDPETGKRRTKTDPPGRYKPAANDVYHDE